MTETLNFIIGELCLDTFNLDIVDCIKANPKFLKYLEANYKDKMTYNSSTYKKAAKYVVDNNMTVAEATKKAKGAAQRNTAAFVAAYGAVAIGAAVASAKYNSKYAVLDNAGNVLRRFN